MKKVRKIVSTIVLSSLFLLNSPVVTAEENNFKHELTPNTEKLKHIPFWLGGNRNKTKDEQLCKINSIFKYLDHKGELITYYPEGCQEEEGENFFEEEFNSAEDLDFGFEEESNSAEDLDFSDEEMFLEDDLDFGFDEELNSAEDLDFSDEEMFLEDDLDFGFDEELNSAEDLDFSDEEVFLEDDLGFSDEERLVGGKNFDEFIGLSGKKLAPTIREFAKTKLKVQVGTISTNFIGNNNSYNEKMATLLNKVNNDFKIDSIKNDFAKNVSNLSYSLSTYNNTTDLETKKVFKQKLSRDIENLKNKYKTLKFKDTMISKAIAKRNSM